MKTFCTGVLIILISCVLTSCLQDDDNNGDKEKTVEMTIYPETAYGEYFMSDIWGEFLTFSDSNENTVQTMSGIITEGFADLDFKKGYQYALRVKKIWMKNPPQDVSSVKYSYLETLQEKKMITEDRELLMELIIAPQKVKFIPRGEKDLQSALLVKETGETRKWPLIHIEGFDFEEGYTYTVRVRKSISASPYRVHYILKDIISKKQATGKS
ncbi:DUF4377 domain-containing protein [Sinomicrobium oceani]|uniref:DUF4377 domain-containing protein n=1 Tax=Sinomicrobium oceani TaxID=1150368 RepID=UPI00227B7DF5|nr:DUF4377 domain-containing protein [Sinomicrobium oceani]